LEQQWNDTDREKLKYKEKNLFQWHCVHQEFHMDWPGTEARVLQCVDISIR